MSYRSEVRLVIVWPRRRGSDCSFVVVADTDDVDVDVAEPHAVASMLCTRSHQGAHDGFGGSVV